MALNPFQGLKLESLWRIYNEPELRLNGPKSLSGIETDIILGKPGNSLCLNGPKSLSGIETTKSHPPFSSI